jgi:Tol biopolymer transport system component
MKLFLLFFLILSSCCLFLPAQDMFPVRQLTSGPEQKGFPSWSPDSKSIVYQITTWNDTLGNNGLWIVSPDGKNPRRIFRGIAEHPKWSPDSRFIVFDSDYGGSIKLLPARGGDIIDFLPDSVQIENGGLPCWSPDASKIAFIERKCMSICTYDLNTGELETLFREEGKLPVPGGWWNDGKSMLVAPMDLKSRKSTILRISADGMEKTRIEGHLDAFYRHLALSPDGTLLVYAVFDGKYLGLYIMPSDGGPSLPLTVTGNSHNEGPSWSPDSKSIAFNSTRSGNFDIWIMDVDIEKIKQQLKNAK